MTSTDVIEHESIRTEHTGALRRPEWLNELYARLGEGTASLEELGEGQERAVREVIEAQERVGLPVVTDGEFCRIGGFQESFGGAVTGFDALPYVYRRRNPLASSGLEPGQAPRRIETGLSGPGTAIYNRLPVKQLLQLTRNLVLEEYRRAAAFATRPVKVTLIGPDRISQRFEYETSRQVYAGMDEFLSDVIEIERRMIAEVVSAGCRYVQIDEPGYTAYVDPPLLRQMRERGEDPDENLARSIRADNAVIAGFPGVTFAVHICRGNSGGRGGAGWHREGHYDAIAERLFTGLNFDRFLLEYDSEQAGSFEALRFLPADKVGVLGLVSNHGEPESESYLLSRIEEASRYLPVERMALCPRCGFGSAPEDVQWSKLRVMQAVAERVWPAL